MIDDSKLFPDFILPPKKLLSLPSLQPYQASDCPLTAVQIEELIETQGLRAAGWYLDNDATTIVRRYVLENYLLGLNFVVYLGAAAEAVNHHPELQLSYAELTVSWSSHRIKGLHRNDLVMAKYSDRLLSALASRKNL